MEPTPCSLFGMFYTHTHTHTYHNYISMCVCVWGGGGGGFYQLRTHQGEVGGGVKSLINIYCVLHANKTKKWGGGSDSM